jgi:hypothetical protein
MKASKLLSKKQRKEQYSQYTALNLKRFKITFEKFLTNTYKLKSLDHKNFLKKKLTFVS